MTISPARKLITRLQTIFLLVCVSTMTMQTSLAQSCAAKSGNKITPVIELYTSEGCSSCPPADKWLSTFKNLHQLDASAPVVQSFHVDYWNYIGWTDRYASPAHTVRQRQISAWQNSNTIYTPQVVLNGRDLRTWNRWNEPPAIANVAIAMQQEVGNVFSAQVQAPSSMMWSAYWTVTEDGHSSKVQAGENSGELLKHDFVVRQYQLAGDRTGNSKLILQTGNKDMAHPRRINLVIFHPQTGKTLQALSLNCS
ncbi:MAG: DUF1223 domain-containing protein [Cytophagales bacterium]|nr:DUF1223 domain-containing protein [Cytophagales bacterium]